MYIMYRGEEVEVQGQGEKGQEGKGWGVMRSYKYGLGGMRRDEEG